MDKFEKMSISKLGTELYFLTGMIGDEEKKIKNAEEKIKNFKVEIDKISKILTKRGKSDILKHYSIKI